MPWLWLWMAANLSNSHSRVEEHQTSAEEAGLKRNPTQWAMGLEGPDLAGQRGGHASWQRQEPHMAELGAPKSSPVCVGSQQQGYVLALQTHVLVELYQPR